MIHLNNIFCGDAIELIKDLAPNSIAACITDPPYNYEFIGHKWDKEEIARRMSRTASAESKTLVKNIPYGSHLAGGVRDKRWYERIRENINEYQNWCETWAKPLFNVCKPGAPVAVFNSTRTAAHVQIALERAGFYARDILVYRRHSGIPKGLNMSAKLRKKGDPTADKWNGWHSAFRNEWEAIVLVQKPLENNYETTIEKYGVGLFQTIDSDGSFSSNIIEGISNRRSDKENSHINQKPLLLMQKLIEMLVPISPDNIVLDPFCGSGTTLLAAKMLSLPYIGFDNDPDCVTYSLSRVEAYRDILTVNDKTTSQRIKKVI